MANAFDEPIPRLRGTRGNTQIRALKKDLLNAGSDCLRDCAFLPASHFQKGPGSRRFRLVAACEAVGNGLIV